METRQKHCEFCGRFFLPDRRVGKKQRCCLRPACKKARKRASQVSWAKKNQDYFTERYDNTRRWLEAHPGYLRQRRHRLRDIQDTIPDLSARKSVRLLLPAKWFRSDIQDTMVQITIIDSETYLGTEGEVLYKTRLA